MSGLKGNQKKGNDGKFVANPVTKPLRSLKGQVRSQGGVKSIGDAVAKASNPATSAAELRAAFSWLEDPSNSVDDSTFKTTVDKILINPNCPQPLRERAAARSRVSDLHSMMMHPLLTTATREKISKINPEIANFYTQWRADNGLPSV